MGFRVLVVEDSVDILSNVVEYLSTKGWSVEGTCSSADAWERLQAGGIDLLVLDIGLPGMDGLTLCRRIRLADAKLPILMLTARDSIDDRVDGLSAGADDYLVKPFSLRELAARLEALLRRAYGAENAVLRVADLALDCRTMRVTRAGRPIELNPTCLKILKTLMLASPGIVSRERLEAVVWSGMLPPASDSLRSNMYLLRQAVDKPFAASLIQTHPRLGWSVSAGPRLDGSPTESKNPC